jgi:hypothetical protein
VAVGEDGDGGADLEALGGGEEVGGHERRGGAGAVFDEVVLGGPHAVESGRFRLPRIGDDSAECRRRRDAGEHSAEEEEIVSAHALTLWAVFFEEQP